MFRGVGGDPPDPPEHRCPLLSHYLGGLPADLGRGPFMRTCAPDLLSRRRFGAASGYVRLPQEAAANVELRPGGLEDLAQPKEEVLVPLFFRRAPAAATFLPIRRRRFGLRQCSNK